MFKLLPRISTLIYCFILPTIISLYIFTDRNLVNTVGSNEVDYFVFAQDQLGLVIIEQSWQIWLARIFDFVFWGVIGGIFLFIFWTFSASRIAVHNHLVQEEFVNFRIPRNSWHGHFITIAAIKIFLAVSIIYSFVILIFRALPKLIETVAALASDNPNFNMWLIVKYFGFVVVMQYLIIYTVKLFNAVHTND